MLWVTLLNNVHVFRILLFVTLFTFFQLKLFNIIKKQERRRKKGKKRKKEDIKIKRQR